MSTAEALQVMTDFASLIISLLNLMIVLILFKNDKK
ncbi:putative holin-like toxin [uncultured Streptococcus sp.]|nr:putative holin-like toxin [uncultured Streptococcus sp.]